MNRYPSITIRIDQDLLDAIDMIAEGLNMTRSCFVRLALEEKFDREIMREEVAS